jgi:hypothetical protein
MGNASIRPVHGLQERSRFRLGEDHRETLGLPGPIEVGPFVPLGPEHVAMEKQKRIQGPILR